MRKTERNRKREIERETRERERERNKRKPRKERERNKTKKRRDTRKRELRQEGVSKTCSAKAWLLGLNKSDLGAAVGPEPNDAFTQKKTFIYQSATLHNMHLQNCV